MKRPTLRRMAGSLLLLSCAGAYAAPQETLSAQSELTQPAVDQTAAARALPACSAIPTMPNPSKLAKNVLDFGAIPDDELDDTDSIRAAINHLEEGEWLVFPPGRYLHSGSIKVAVRGAKLYGAGAHLHASNPDSMAVMLSADNVGLFGFRLTAETTVRKSAPEHARIAINGVDRYGKSRRISGVTVLNNTIEPDGREGERYANSSSASGIFVYNAFNFLIGHNTINRTIADGIHVTAGSEQGRILGNHISQTGDDMIGLVSYGSGGKAAIGSAGDVKARILNGTGKNRHILVQSNRLKDNYSGRGISVIGGDSISLLNNVIAQVPGAAGILLAREHNWMSHGLSNVLVRSNTISDIQTGTPPGYNFGKTIEKTGHGAIEIHSFVFDDEFDDGELRDLLTVDGVLLSQNTLRDSGVSALRVGVRGGGYMYEFPDNDDDKGRSRHYRTNLSKRIEFRKAALSHIGGLDFKDAGSDEETISCSEIRKDGNPFTAVSCAGAPVAVSGAVLEQCAN